MAELSTRDDEPQVILVGGTDELRLEEGGRVYRPGDVLPKNLSHARRVALQQAGIRFATRHPEPVLLPDGRPAGIAAAEQIDGPVVVAAIEAVPADDPKPEQPRRAARKDSD